MNIKEFEDLLKDHPMGDYLEISYNCEACSYPLMATCVPLFREGITTKLTYVVYCKACDKSWSFN